MSKVDNFLIEDPEPPLEIEFQDNSVLIELCGVRDQNIIFLEDKLGIQITRRGNKLLFSGNFDDQKKAANILKNIYFSLEEGRSFEGNDIIDFILTSLKMSNFSLIEKQQESQVNQYDLKTKKKLISPRNYSQKDFIENLINYDLTFGVGPAGTGKTYVAIAVAVSMFLKGQVDKVILTRPAVEAGERLGYLPGDLSQKIDPYLVPLFDALEHFFGNEKLGYLIEKRNIEIVPLAYMRGRTLDNACIILDEAQNATSNQIKMFLTRLGENSKIIITGDETQIDLYKKDYSGLRKTRKKLSNIDEISVMEFQNSDIVRNPIVSKILEVFPEK